MEDRNPPGGPEDDEAAETPPVHASGPGRARIAGVEAGVAAGLFPSTSPPVEPSGVEPGAGTVPLPDWTDPPTREVPRVLFDPTSVQRTVPGPVWREIGEDWDHDDLFADMVEEAQSRASDDFDDEPWLEPSRPAAGLVLKGSAGSEPTEPSGVLPGGDSQVEEPEVAFEDEQHGLRARVAWAGRGGRRRVAPPEHGTTAAHPERQPVPEPESATAATDEFTARPERSPRSGRSPVVATATGVAFGAVALLCFYAGPPATLALVAFVLAVAVSECYQALRRAHYQPAALLGLVAAPGAAVAAYLKGTAGLVLVAVLLVGLTFLWYLAGITRRSPVANIAATILGWAWVGLLGGFAGLIVSPTVFGHRAGLAFLLGAVEATVAYDVAGYAVGSWLGRHKLAPQISPNKTWEGLLGGSVAAIVVALVITSRMHPWTLPRAAELGLVVAVVAPIGDLVESLVKRDLQLKDMGTLLPAHGGLLDRVDAILFVLPATYYLVRLFHG